MDISKALRLQYCSSLDVAASLFSKCLGCNNLCYFFPSDNNLIFEAMEKIKIHSGSDNYLPFKGVIFDMDGTLIASTEADFLAWKNTFADYNKELTYETYFPLLGMKSQDVIKKILKLHTEEVDGALAKKMFHFEEIMKTKGIDPIPFAEDLLKRLKKLPVKIALATSSRNMKMNLVMKKLNFLQYFDKTVTGEEVHNSKPHPDIFLKAAEKLKLHPEDCVVIEDAANGVTAAKSAGMKCIAITTTHSKDQLQHADIIIDTFEEFDYAHLCAAAKDY